MRRVLAAALLVAQTWAANADEAPRFEIQTGEVRHTYTGGWEHFVGGGVAVFDCSGDGLPELYIAGGSSQAQLFRNQSQAAAGKLRFKAETPAALAMTGVTGAYPLDIDGDDRLDLVVLRVGENRLMRGTGNCEFEPFDAIGYKSRPNAWTTAFSATWEHGNALPTLAFGNYVDRADPTGPFRACDQNDLYRPHEGTYVEPLPLKPGYCALSMLFSDWNRTGSADLRVSNDRQYYVRGGEEQLWAMEPTPRLYTSQDGWKSYSIWGMGIASRDLDGDGLPEVFLTSMGDQKLHLRDRSARGPVFRDATYDRGTTAQRPYLGDDGRPSTGWHVAFGDVNNDGRDDIFIAKGNVEQMPSNAMADPNNLLMQLPDGNFAEAGLEAGIASFDRSRGASLTDLDADGRLDLVVVNREEPVEIYRNVTPASGHWLEIALHQEGGNRHAVGSWIEIRAGGRTISREITVGGGHASGSSGVEHFGLGPASTVDMRVIWPDGDISAWQTIGTDRIIDVTRGDGDLPMLH